MLIDNVIVTWLFWHFWYFINPLGKNLIGKYSTNFFLTRKILITYGKWNTPIFREPVNTEFHIRPFLYLFGASLILKDNTVWWRLNLIHTDSNMLNSLVMFNFSIVDWKYSFWDNLVQKFKILCLRWNFVHRLNRICQSQWWYSVF